MRYLIHCEGKGYVRSISYSKTRFTDKQIKAMSFQNKELAENMLVLIKAQDDNPELKIVEEIL